MANAVNQTGQSMREGLQRVGEDAGRIKEDLSAMGHSIADTARTGAAAAKDVVKQGAERARERGQVLAEALCDHVAERPLTSLALAAGVGMVLGLIIFRPRA